MLNQQYFMHPTVQFLVGSAVAVLAVGTLWKKLILPTSRLVTLLNQAIPMLGVLVEQFKGTPYAFQILNSVVKEFRTNSGTSLRDCIDRLERVATENKVTSTVLAANAEVARKLAEHDRQQIAYIIEMLDRVGAKQRENIKTVDRLESGAKIVASELDAAQTRAEKVEGEPGAAADAAVRRI